MLFADVLDSISEWGSAHLPAVIGGGVALVVLLVVFFPRRKPEPRLDPDKLAPSAPAPPNPFYETTATNWEPPEHSYADRRSAVRREGQVVRVVVTSPSFRGGAQEGYVLDRSTGGLKLAMMIAANVGATLQVRATNAPDTVGFVGVIVRSCRQNGDHFEIGCEFEKTPPWNVLLLFG